MATYKLIETVTVGSGGAASIAFTSIPATYTDIVILGSVRSTRSALSDSLFIKVNTSTSPFSGRIITGNGSSASSGTQGDGYIGEVSAASSSALTFNSLQIYIPNYGGSTNKSISIENVSEDNATLAYQNLQAQLWSNTAAITGFSLYAANGNLTQYSSVSLYGISNS